MQDKRVEKFGDYLIFQIHYFTSVYASHYKHYEHKSGFLMSEIMEMKYVGKKLNKLQSIV